MATNPQKRQKQLVKKKAKRKVVVTAKKMIDKLGGLLSQTALEKAPIHECQAANSLFETGIGTVVLSREIQNGDLAVGFFMLDVWCLGVKSAFFARLTETEYQEKLQEIASRENLQPVSPAYARKLVEDCAAYAKNLGFSPDPDYKKAKRVFGDIDPNECSETFEFGKEGQPFYFSGPYDTPEKMRKIVNTLTKTCGADNFHYVAHQEPFENEEEDKLEFKA
ncbi:conserved hypothetical protein [Beggiatoa sp. PS]|nr:conserved hypothetical protein [Beggiatoa sp. PS]